MTNTTCRRCGGHGKDPRRVGTPCLRCYGKGTTVRLNAADKRDAAATHRDEVLASIASETAVRDGLAAKGRSTRISDERIARMMALAADLAAKMGA